MVELKRKYLISELENEPDVEIIYKESDACQEQIGMGWLNIKCMPIPQREKKRLRDFLIHSNESGLIRIRSGRLYIKRWPNGELRCFLTTSNGCLIEPYIQENWYSAYSFLKSINHSRVIFDDSKFEGKGKIENRIWLTPSDNYTHFILDSIAPLVQLALDMPQWKEQYEQYGLFTLNILKEWQKEFIELLGNKPKEIQLVKSEEELTYLELENIFVPIKTNQIDSHKNIRRRITQKYNIEGYRDLSSPSIIMITRDDERRARIENIEAIEEFVKAIGGSIIEATKINLTQKIKLFSNCRVCIAESSGCTNWSLFAPEESTLIALTDADVINSPEFTLGGFIYYIGLANRIKFLPGIKTGDLIGSPLGSSRYNLREIKNIIMRSC